MRESVPQPPLLQLFGRLYGVVVAHFAIVATPSAVIRSLFQFSARRPRLQEGLQPRLIFRAIGQSHLNQACTAIGDRVHGLLLRRRCTVSEPAGPLVKARQRPISSSFQMSAGACAAWHGIGRLTLYTASAGHRLGLRCPERADNGLYRSRVICHHKLLVFWVVGPCGLYVTVPIIKAPFDAMGCSAHHGALCTKHGHRRSAW